MPYTTLVSPEQLAANPSWRAFDCRHDLASPDAGALAYRESHIPGALHASIDRELSSSKNGRNGRHPLPVLGDFTAWLRRSGVKPGDQVVSYDASEGIFAARLWWLLRAAGHEAVAVLDGGWPRWLAERRPTTQAIAAFEPSDYAVASWKASQAVDVDAVQANLRAPAFTVVDARASNRYEGRDETMDPVAGHIPGALNRPYSRNLRKGRFKPAAELREDFDALLQGRAPQDIVHQCGSGVTACHNLLAMEVAGLSGSRLYPGSWSEWSSDPLRPVATGPNPT